MRFAGLGRCAVQTGVGAGKRPAFSLTPTDTRACTVNSAPKAKVSTRGLASQTTRPCRAQTSLVVRSPALRGQPAGALECSLYRPGHRLALECLNSGRRTVLLPCSDIQGHWPKRTEQARSEGGPDRVFWRGDLRDREVTRGINQWTVAKGGAPCVARHSTTSDYRRNKRYAGLSVSFTAG